MKKKIKQIVPVCALFLACFTTKVSAAGLEVQASDVITVLKNCVPYIIGMLAAILIAVVAAVVVRKYDRKKKFILRKQCICAGLFAFMLFFNLACTGPLSTLLDVVVNPVKEVSEATKKEASLLITDIAGEGAVLLKNDGTLPLSKDVKKLNVFGWASTNPCYGGTGSGAVDTSNCVSLLDGIKAGGYEINQTLTDMYTAYAPERGEAGMSSVDWTLPEPTVDYYTDEILEEAKEFSDTAVIVIARVGGEGTDLPTDFGAKDEQGEALYTYTDNSTEYKDFVDGQHYLELSQTEKNMVDIVCSNFDHVIVICNSANAMELGWVEDYDQIGSVISCPGAGETGFAALGKILDGEVNPSGKLADTYVYDLTATPAFNNFGDFSYDNMDEYGWLESNPFSGESKMNDVNFVNYVENIYVGYKFYETAYTEAQAGNMDFDYEKVVQYPFGYGLSYTNFEQKITDSTETADGIELTVEVTNTGDVVGKEVVEVYYNPPYSNGKIEKASVNLIDFGKTKLLNPGEKETLTFSICKDDMASYDAKENRCYVLDEGEYELSIRSDAHTVLDTVTYEVPETIIYDEENARTSDLIAATNQFDYAQGDDVIYLSRANGFENYEEATAAPQNFTMPEERKANYRNITNYDIEAMNDASDEMPVTGADNKIRLVALRGKDYDDELWDELLDELTIDDMTTLIGGGGYQTTAIETIDKVATTDNDGPATIYNNYTGAAGSAYTTEVMLANTWNKEIAYQMGKSVGKEADEMDVSGWYAPAMNIHRTAFGGRNFEYYSEDGLLSGVMAANEVKGAAEYGVYGYMKHFALNDQETNRIYQMCLWSTEQAIRETYLKAFEIAVKEGNIGAVMDAHSFIGDRWCGASSELNINVLRDEWGFQGFVSTDMFAGFGYYDADIAIRSGVDSMLSPMNSPDATVTDTQSATSVKAMRKSCHNILYTVVNSRAYNAENVHVMVLWKKLLILIDVWVLVILAAVEGFSIRKYRKWNDEIN